MEREEICTSRPIKVQLLFINALCRAPAFADIFRHEAGAKCNIIYHYESVCNNGKNDHSQGLGSRPGAAMAETEATGPELFGRRGLNNAVARPEIVLNWRCWLWMPYIETGIF